MNSTLRHCRAQVDQNLVLRQAENSEHHVLAHVEFMSNNIMAIAVADNVYLSHVVLFYL